MFLFKNQVLCKFITISRSAEKKYWKSIWAFSERKIYFARMLFEWSLFLLAGPIKNNNEAFRPNWYHSHYGYCSL